MNRSVSASLILPLALIALASGCGDGDGDPSPVTSSQNPGVMASDDPGGETGVVSMPLDRMGRPGITTALIAEDAVKDAYNFNGDPDTWAAEFLPPMIERAEIIDGLDGTVGDALLDDAATLTALLADDRLQIDTRVPECDTYLAVEIGLGDCGGRTLDRDVIDDTLRHLVSQDMPLDDLANSDNVLLTDWPFFGEPND